MATEAELKERIQRILSGQPGQPPPFDRQFSVEDEPPRRRFSSFIPEDVQAAVDLSSQMMAAAEGKPANEGMTKAVEQVEGALQQEELRGLAQYALKLFLLHYPPARSFFRLAPLEARQPLLAASSATPSGLLAPTSPPYQGLATPPEDRLSWFREDPLLNEHHEHWHLVYPLAGSPSPTGGYALGDRHGELFAYMHEQMIARYDAERLAVQLKRVREFSTAEYVQSIAEGYDPGILTLWNGFSWSAFGARPAGSSLGDLLSPYDTRPGAKLADQVNFFNINLKAAATQQYPNGRQVTIDNLGGTEEATTNSVDYFGKDDPANWMVNGNHHNDGHIHFMAFNNKNPYGVMGDPATAIRDPIFFRWHKHVDRVFQAFEDAQPPHSLSVRPPVVIDSAASGLGNEPFTLDTVSGDVRKNGKIEFPAAGLALTSELLTEMLSRPIHVQDQSGNPVTVMVEYLSHDDYSYLIPVRNESPDSQKVTIRIFIAPETEIEDRRAWIEMDKFVLKLNGNEHAVIVRPSDLSSVVRKPALRPTTLGADDEPDAATEPAQWCDCGWPYTLLLPRGTAEGMTFRLFVMLSDGDDLPDPDPSTCCNSISYCGLQDKDYPDKKPMGYPFSRPLPQPVSTEIASYPNLHSWKFTIRCKNI